MAYIEWKRLVNSLVSGVRFTFGGAAGAVTYGVITSGGPILLELILFLVLLLLVAFVEYPLRKVEV